MEGTGELDDASVLGCDDMEGTGEPDAASKLGCAEVKKWEEKYFKSASEVRR